MKLKIIKEFLIIVLLVCFFLPADAAANATPVYMSGGPSFSIAPWTDSHVRVDKETLSFYVDENAANRAKVTASYSLTNTSQEALTLPLVFPFISEGYHDDIDVVIESNGKTIDYELFTVGRVNTDTYFDNPAHFHEQVDINKILAKLHEPVYQAGHFDEAAVTALYKVTFNDQANRRAQVDFTIDPQKTGVLSFGFNGFEIKNNGEITLSKYVDIKDLGTSSYLLVLGEDTLKDIIASFNDSLEKTRVTTGEFLTQALLTVTDKGIDLSTRNWDNIYSFFLNEIDEYLSAEQPVFDFEMVLEGMLQNNIKALLYEVEFAGGSSNTLSVTYPVTATIDRRKTKDYLNTFAYILHPAENFDGFGGVDIVIELNAECPFIIDSSLPLSSVSPGVYKASFDGLPAADLVFSTYPKEKISFSDQAAFFLNRGSGIFLLAAGGLILAIIFFYKKRWDRTKGRIDI